jgi:hypothetical protein
MINKENEFLDYETCKLLKEVGFDESCEYLYGTAVRYNGEDISFDDELDLKSEGRGSEIEYIEGGNISKVYNRNSFGIMMECKCVSAPDIYTVTRWLRKKKDVNVVVDYNGDIHQWSWSSTHCSTGEPYPYDGVADSYESAAKNAILYFVKNVLKKTVEGL